MNVALKSFFLFCIDIIYFFLIFYLVVTNHSVSFVVSLTMSMCLIKTICVSDEYTSYQTFPT